MNLVDITIVEVLEDPKQVVNEEDCYWKVTVITDCYGARERKVFKAVSLTEIKKYKKGYSYQG